MEEAAKVPRLTLEAISFRAGDPLANAPLPLRWDAFRSVAVPEWERARNTRASDSPVAYTLAALRTNAISILCRFHLEDSAASFLIRARANPGGIFGNIAEFRVDFAMSGDQYVSIPVCVTNQPQGIDQRIQEWTWEFRPAGNPVWTALADSAHQVFVILNSPGPPWAIRGPHTLAWPWVLVLEKVCDWARGSKTVDEASAAICQKLIAQSEVKRHWFLYDLNRTFSYFVEHRHLHLQSVLDTIDGVACCLHNVNCVDAAAIVSTLANLIGARLRQTRLTKDDNGLFKVNPGVPLGAKLTPAAPPNAFRLHEVAIGPEDDVWDLCFKLESAGQYVPSIKVPYPRYIQRLVVSKDIAHIQRKAVNRNAPVFPAPLAIAKYLATGDLVISSRPARLLHGHSRVFIHGLYFQGGVGKWELIRPAMHRVVTRLEPGLQLIGSGGDPYVRYEDSIWSAGRGLHARVVRLQSYVTPAPRYAQGLARKRGAEEGEQLKRHPIPGDMAPNEIVFTAQGSSSVLRIFANVLCLARPLGRKKAPGAEADFTAALRDLLLGRPDSLACSQCIRMERRAIEFNGLEDAALWWKFFCPSGAIVAVAGRLCFEPGPDSANEVEIAAYAMEGDRPVKHVILIVNTGDTQ